MANPRSPFLGKGVMHPFIHLSIGFWLYTALQCRSSMSSNCLVFHTSGGISSSPAVFLFLIFLRTESSSSCVNGPSLMSNCLLIILVIGLCVIFGGFPSKFSKCCFHSFILSCWFAAFSFAMAVFFLLLTSFIVCQAILDCLLRDCFVASQLFRVAIHVRYFTLGSKPGWLYVSRISYPRANVILSMNEIIVYVIIFTFKLWTTKSAQFLRRGIRFLRMWSYLPTHCMGLEKQ